MSTNKNDQKKPNTHPSSKINAILNNSSSSSSHSNHFSSLPARSATPSTSASAEQSFSTVPLVRKPPVRPMSPPSSATTKKAAAALEVPPATATPRRPKRAAHKQDPRMRRSLSLNHVDVVQIPGSVTVRADTTEHLVDACQQYLDRNVEARPDRPPPSTPDAADEIVVDKVDVVTVGSNYGTHPRVMKKNVSRTWVPAMKRMFEKRAGSAEPSEIRLRVQLTPQRTRRSASPAVAVTAAPGSPGQGEEAAAAGDSAKSDGTESVSSFVALSVENTRSLHSPAENDAATDDGDEDDERARNKGFLNKCMVRVKRAMSNSN